MFPKGKPVMSLGDIERIAIEKGEKMHMDFVKAGSNEGQTLAENFAGFNFYRIRARSMIDVSTVKTTSKSLLGKQYSVPIGIAPSAFHCIMSPEGELDTARAAHSRQWPMCLSSYSSQTPEDVLAQCPDTPLFFQLYVFKNKQTSADLVRRVEKAGYKAIVLTVDTPFIGRRYDDFRNAFKVPHYVKLGNFDSSSSGPVDIGSEAASDARTISGDDSDKVKRDSQANVIDPSMTWETTLPWLQSITKLPIWVKGVTTYEDAKLAVQYGAAGIWVSNHGGRQIDSGISTIEALPEVVEAVAGRVPVHVDGGFRKGSDVFKALALGADFVWLGRPVLYALKWNGRDGLEYLQSLLEEDFRTTMALAGCTSVDQISKKCLVRVGPRMERL